MFIERGRPLSTARVDAAVDKVARAAGLEGVSPHQLRHTLATQAINRGMSLEAIAALLGHRSLSMTLVYARIADRTVADEYFAVSEKVEALYDQPRALAADAEGAEMAKLRKRDAPAHARQRLLRTPGRARLPLRVDLRRPAPTSSPPSSSDPPCSANATTPQRRANSAARRSSTGSSPDSATRPPDRRSHHPDPARSRFFARTP